MEFLNHYLCDKVFADPQYWLETLFDVLHRHQHNGIPLLINEQIDSGSQLVQQVKEVLKFLSERSRKSNSKGSDRSRAIGCLMHNL